MNKEPIYSVERKNGKFILLCNGKEDVRVLPCKTMGEISKCLTRLLNKEKQKGPTTC